MDASDEWDATDDGELFTAGALIPIENFPPAMRAERAAAYRRAEKKARAS